MRDENLPILAAVYGYTRRQIDEHNMSDFMRLVIFAESVKEVRDEHGGW